MIDRISYVFAYFTSIIAIITLDLFLGTTLVQLHVNLQNAADVKNILRKAATCWGLLNWILSMFLFFSGINFIFIYIIEKPIISVFLRIILLFLIILPYIMRDRYKRLSWPGKNTMSLLYPISVILVLYAVYFEIPYFSHNNAQDIRWAIHILWPSIIIIIFQVANLAKYGVWHKILHR